MDWRFMRRELLTSTAVALAVCGAFASIGAAPLVLSLPVLIFDGPLTDLLLEWMRSRNPGSHENVRAPRWYFIATAGWLALIAGIAALLAWRWGLAYWRAFARTWLVLQTAGAINAIVAEWEDNMPGGFLNPNLIGEAAARGDPQPRARRSVGGDHRHEEDPRPRLFRGGPRGAVEDG